MSIHKTIRGWLQVSPLLIVLAMVERMEAAGPLEYNRDVRPILSENCFACHGPDSASRKAGLRLDRRDEAIKAKAIVPGSPGGSALVSRIHAADPMEQMPPPATKKKLTQQQREILSRWIAAGAEYQPHWSLIPPKKPALPEVKNNAWVRNPIDRFILARLEAAGLQPAPEADRQTLARRLSLDLIGLPPKPDEVEAFVNDKSADYYEKYVARLMASPHWGEHRGRYWLDAARYADTHGIHFDNFREIWAYRDWVTRAFNDNKPFDQFTIEQLAGDLLPNRTVDQQIASGFNRCNITTNEGGAIAEEYLVLYTRDRTETTFAVWQGLTANCAVCHDHKFDPISQKEFYSASAFFNNTTQNAMDGNIQNTPPIINVPRLDDRPRWEALTREIQKNSTQMEARARMMRGEFDKWLANAKELPAQQDTTEGVIFRAPFDEGVGTEVAFLAEGKTNRLKLGSGYAWSEGRSRDKALLLRAGSASSIQNVGDFDNTGAFTISAWVKIQKRGQNGAIIARMDTANKFRGWDLWLQGDRIGSHFINTWPENAVKVVAVDPLKLNKWTHVIVTHDGTGKAAGFTIYYDGVAQKKTVEADKLSATTRTTVPLKIGQRNVGDRVSAVAVQDLRLYNRALSAPESTRLAKSQRALEILAKPADKRTPAERDEVFRWWLPEHDATYRDYAAQLAHAQQEQAAIKARGTSAYVMNENSSPPSAYILMRGDYDKRKEMVKPSTPAALPPFPDSFPRNRLGFAKWLLLPEQPLTARVTVNRYWQELFGTGLVRTSGDFGVAGELPSHPELLDWLALEFRDSGWDIKKFFTLLVSSSAYRQSAVSTPLKNEKDPGNRLLSRGPRFRMDAEMIRDYALAASGLLVEKIGGPSVKPYQPSGVWEAVAMIGSNTRNYVQDKGENLYRRSMYTFWKRAAPPASMEIFNAPNRETCAVRRERTNTPLQALVTLNDPQFVEAARALAERTMTESDDAKGLDYLARRILCRPLHENESAILAGVKKDLLAYYKEHPDDARKLLTVGEFKNNDKLDPSQLATWTMVANQLFNLDETLNK